MTQLGNQCRESSLPGGDAKSPACRGGTYGPCRWCGGYWNARHSNAKYCSRKCRQTAFRFRRKLDYREYCDKPLKLAYADPPYPGCAKKYYGEEPTYGGEVDHSELIEGLKASFDGWALSTSASALGDILPLCGDGVHVCAWVKPIGVSSRSSGLVTTWEPLIVKPARSLPPGVRDWLSAQPARGGGDLIGRKPLAFCAFLFAALGASPADDFADLFPGTGVVLKAWKEFTRAEYTKKNV